MNKEQIIAWAREAGCVEDKHYKGEVIFISNDALERFFHMAQAAEREALEKKFAVVFESVRAWEDWCKSIRENEREACAKVCDVNKHYFGYQCAEAIRNRGQA